MKKRQILALAGVLLIVGVLLSASSSAAKSTKTPVDFWEVSCEADPGITWISDGILHGRGRVSQAVLYVEDPPNVAKVVGSDTVIGNINLDLATGNARAFGSFTLIYIPAPGSPNGTFDGTFNGSITGGFLFSGKAVGRGTGDLRPKKMKVSIESEPVPDWLRDVAAVPCDEEGLVLPGIFRDKGFIHSPHGD